MKTFEPQHEISNNVLCATSKASDQTALAHKGSLIRAFASCVKLLTEHHLEFPSLKGGCTGMSESIHAKMPHCWKSHVAADLWCSSKVMRTTMYDTGLDKQKF